MAGSIRFLNLCVLGLCLLLGQAYAGSSRGCGKALNPKMKKGGTGQSNKINLIISNGAKRSFLLHFPSNYNKDINHGLIFSFHGRSGTPAGQESLSKLSGFEKNKNMLVAYPEGIGRQWQGDPAANTDDVGFTLDMIKSLSDQYCIDPDRIYATGQSNGGGFSANILACDPVASRRIAAFAGVSGAYYQGTSDANCNADTVPITCNPGRRNVPVLEFHGQEDDTIPYNGGKRRNRCLPNIPHFIRAWSSRNGYGASSSDSSLYSGHVRKMEFGSGNLKGINTHYAIDNMPHTWPNAKACYMNATPVVMDFFNKWTLTTTPNARDTINSAPATDTICPSRNGQTYNADGKDFKISCSADTPSTPAYTYATYPGSFAGCLAQCAGEAQCGHAVYFNDRCWKKRGNPSKVAGAGANARVGVKV
jgi:poly(3-hydroxybutyrate) depolymerase